MQPWDRDHIHRLFDDLEFRVLRDRLFDTLAAARPEVDEGFDVRGGALGPRRRGGLAGRARSDGRESGLSVVGTTQLASTATPPRSRSPPPTATAATSTPRADARRRGGARRLAGRRRPAEGPARGQVAIHALAARGWELRGITSDTALAAYLVRPGQRSFALDDLSLRYLRRELRADNPEQAQLSLLDDDDGVDDQAVQAQILRASAVLDLADALDDGTGTDRLRRRCSTTWSCPFSRCWRISRTPGSPSISGMLTELQQRVRRARYATPPRRRMR